MGIRPNHGDRLGPVEGDRDGATANPMGSARATAHKGRTLSAKGATVRTGSTNETDAKKGGGHAQDTARERQLGPPQKRTRTPPRRSEGWNG